MIRTIMVLVALAVGSTAIAQQDAYTLKSKLAHLELEKYELEENVFVPLRDGIRLSAEIRFPKGDRKNLPTVLIRSPYEPATQARSWALRMVSFLENGYAVAFVNERGRYWSEGEYQYLVGAKEDGYDTVDWIVKQTWSNGKVGTIGCSSSAEHQLGMASQDHPGHAAAIPMAPGAGIGKMGPFLEQGNFYRGGVWQPLFFGWYYGWAWRERPFVPKEATREDRVRLSRLYDLHPKVPAVDLAKAIRHLPLQYLMPNIQGLKSPFNDFILRTPGDPKWAETDFFNEGDDYGVPTLWVFSWYDISVMPNIELFNYVRKNGTDPEVRDNQFMVVSTMPHCAMGRETEQTVVGERFLGDARYDYQTLFVRWFDRWLKGEDNGVTNRSKVESYLMGKNEWRRYDGWPHPETNFVTYYLASSGDANSSLGDGRLATVKPSSSAHDTFVYDPGHPVPSLGGGFCCMGTDAVPGAFDQSYLEAAPRRPRLYERAARGGRQRDRADRGDALRLVRCKRHGLRGQDPRRLSGWHGLQSRRLDPACPLSRRLRQGSVHETGRGLRSEGRTLGHQQLFQERPPHPHRRIIEQLPAIRTQSQHRGS